MSAFLNSLHEEGTRDEILYWIGQLAEEKNASIVWKSDDDRRTLLRELVRLYYLPEAP